MAAFALLRPLAFWLVLPLLAIVVWLLRRGGGAPRQAAAVWLFQEEQQHASGRRRLAWRNPLAAGVLVAGLLWIVAWAAPVARRGPVLPALVLLDAGVPAALAEGTDASAGPGAENLEDARRLEQLTARWRKRAAGIDFYVAGCAPAGPFTDLAQARAATPAPDGPTLGELLVMLAPDAAQPVAVFSWRPGPPAFGAWRSHAIQRPGARAGRLVQASLDGDSQLAVAAVGGDGAPLGGGRVLVVVGADTLRLTLDAGGRAEANLADLSHVAQPLEGAHIPAIQLQVEQAAASAGFDLNAPPRRVAWLACDDADWIQALGAWAGFDVRRIDRARLPATAEEWTAWRRLRSPATGGELFVAVGAPPPALPDSVPWLWIAPAPSRHALLSFGPRSPHADNAEHDASWEGLDLSRSDLASALLASDASWSVAGGGRVLLGLRAAVLNVSHPLSSSSTSEPALAALRLARRLVPAPIALAGPGLPSPSWDWPAAARDGASDPATGAAPIDGRWARGALIGAVAISLLVMGMAPLRRWLRAVAVVALLALGASALRAPDLPLLLVLDASQSCRDQVPARAARGLVAMGTPAAPALPRWIAALDGAGGRWLATPASPERPPNDEAALAAWLKTRLDALPQSPHSRLAPTMRGLAAAAGLRSASTLLVTDGGFEDTPEALARALPRGPVTVVEVPAGRADDAAIVSLALEEEGGAFFARIVADDGGRACSLEWELDGQRVGERALTPTAGGAEPDFARARGAALHRLSLRLPSVAPGRGRLVARIRWDAPASADLHPQNDFLEVAREESPLKVRWTDARGAERELAGLSATGSAPERFPTTGDVPDVWVLEAVAESVMVSLEPELLAALDQGTGLVMLAGPGSWLATGRSGQRALEGRLPVRLRVPDERDPSPAPWMLAIDASGSMATVEGGTSHFERALVALSAALAAARPEEPIGVLAFAERVLAVLPPRAGLTREQVQSALHGVRPSGGTRLLPALEEASRLLRAAVASPTHTDRPRLVLLSDGLTGPEDALRWQAATAGCQVIALEIGNQGSPALRDLCVSTGGRHRLLRSMDDLAQALTEEALFPPRDRVVAQDEPVRVEDMAWDALAPPRVAVHVALARAEGHAPWTLGRVRDPLLALRETGVARVAVLATSPGEPWAPPAASWQRTMEALVAWTGRRDEPTAVWKGAESPRLALDARAVRWAADSSEGEAGLSLVSAAGDTTRLEAVVPGWYRPTSPPPRGNGRIIARSDGRTVARLPRGDSAAELRARGVERERVAQLAASLPGGTGAPGRSQVAPPRPTWVGLGAAGWILFSAAVVVLLARRAPAAANVRAPDSARG